LFRTAKKHWLCWMNQACLQARHGVLRLRDKQHLASDTSAIECYLLLDWRRKGRREPQPTDIKCTLY
jgi:hypothetical protein